MPITPAMLEARRAWIGSSDVPVIMGFSQYKTAADVWAEKLGKVLPEKKASGAADAGNRFEAGVLDEAEEHLGPIARNVHLKAPFSLKLPFPLATNLDGQVIATGRPAEAKTAGLFGPLTGDWGEENSDQVPDAYLAQAQVHLLITDKDLCYVPTFLGGRGFVMFQVPRTDNDAMRIIIEKCSEFWEHVRNGTPPANSTLSVAIAKRLRRQPKKTISIPDSIVADWIADRDARLAAEKQAKQSEAALLAALGDAEAGTSAHGLLTYFETERRGYTVEPTTFRTLRIKK